MLEEDLKLFLPRYLSEENLTSLRQQLKSFVDGHDSGEYFTTRLKYEPYLFQGDGVQSLMINLPSTETREVPVLLLSNTCDMDITNKRPNPCRIMYAPIINLDKYKSKLKESGCDDERLINHIKDLKNQVISQILYLPTEILWGHGSLVLFDRAISIPLSGENLSKMLESRIFSLSNYGFYLLLLKLSYHFTRIQEKVDRSA